MNPSPYRFDPYLHARGKNWFQTDQVLQKILYHHSPQATRQANDELHALGEFVAGKMFCLSHEAAQKENEPRLEHVDAYDHPQEGVLLCPQTKELFREVYRRQLGCVSGDPFIHYAKLYLISLNGEAGVCCSLACTDGMERILRRFKVEHPYLEQVHQHLTQPTEEKFFHGAQFVTEIQGGSDVAANEVCAIPGKEYFRIEGKKWFCSNITADYFLVTAREEAGLSLFLVPRLTTQGHLNAFRLHRLKDKFGTRELATAEVTFEGAEAYRVGPAGKGVSLVVGHVLVTSRIHCSMGAAGLLRRAGLEAEAYCHFRKAFGKRLVDFALVNRALQTLKQAQQNMLAGFFDLLSRWETLQAHPEDKRAASDTRILISLYKMVATQKSAYLIHEAMMLLGGNGIEERFSVLPRLYRDAVIYETWEGPHFVLLTQAYKDMKTAGVLHDIEGFFKRVLKTTNSSLQSELIRILKDPDDDQALLNFEPWAEAFVTAYQDVCARQLT